MDLEDVRFFIDENTIALGKAIAGLRNDTALIGRPPVDQLVTVGMLDVEWIPIVASRGWVVITIDHHLRTRPNEAGLALEHGLKYVNLKGVGNLTRWAQLVRLANHWDGVEEFARTHPDGPWWLSLNKTGRKEYSYQVS